MSVDLLLSHLPLIRFCRLRVHSDECHSPMHMWLTYAMEGCSDVMMHLTPEHYGGCMDAWTRAEMLIRRRFRMSPESRFLKSDGTWVRTYTNAPRLTATETNMNMNAVMSDMLAEHMLSIVFCRMKVRTRLYGKREVVTRVDITYTVSGCPDTMIYVPYEYYGSRPDLWHEMERAIRTTFHSRYVQSRIGVTYERTQMSHVRS